MAARCWALLVFTRRAAVTAEAVAHAVEEAGQRVLVPFLETVRRECTAGLEPEGCYDDEFVSDMGVDGPASGDALVGLPAVSTVDPTGDGVQPEP